MSKHNPIRPALQSGATLEHLLRRLATTPGRYNQEETRAPQAVAMPINWSLPGREVDNG